MNTIDDSTLAATETPPEKKSIFEDAELLWKEAHSYFNWCTNNPLIDRVIGKDGKVIEKQLIRVFSLEGFCGRLGCSTKHFRERKKECEQNDVLEAIARIEDAIYRQKFELAAAGLLNATIIAKDLGFADKERELNNLSPVIIDFSDNNTADA